MNRHNTKIIIFSVKLLATVLIAGLIIYDLDTVELKYIVKNASTEYIALALLLLPLNLYLQYFKWRYLVLKVSEEKVPDRVIASSVLLGISFGFITPGKIGELGKLFAVSKTNRLKLLSMGIFEKIYDLFPVLIIGIISIPFLPHLFFTDSSVMRFNLIIFSAIVSLIIYFIAVHPGFFKTLIKYFKDSIFKKSKRFSRFAEGIESIEKKDTRILLVFSTLLFITYTGQFAILIHAFGEISIINSLLGVWASIFIKTFLPVSLGDIGVREGVAAYVFALMDFPHEAAVSAAFLLFTINILLPSSFAVFLLPFTKFAGKFRKKST